MSELLPTDPEVLSWPEMQKKAEREGVDISDFVTSMHAHILNQRDALAKQNKRLEMLHAALVDISNGNGAYSRDQYQFACNVIENMKGIAKKALAGTYERE